MYNNQEDEEIQFDHLKIAFGAFVVFVVVATAVIGGVVWQRQARAVAAETARSQELEVRSQKAALAARMQELPRLVDTEEFHEMSIVKVGKDELPKTITAGLDESVDPNPGCEYARVDGYWEVIKDSEVIAYPSHPNGWSVSSGGEVSIPAGAEYGKYTFNYSTSEVCDTPDSRVTSHYVFKITPPCPTSLTLSAAPAS